VIEGPTAGAGLMSTGVHAARVSLNRTIEA
jgi:hypothetical protein